MGLNPCTVKYDRPKFRLNHLFVLKFFRRQSNLHGQSSSRSVVIGPVNSESRQGIFQPWTKRCPGRQKVCCKKPKNETEGSKKKKLKIQGG